jgi:urea ABC transporter permease protein UrtB
MDTLTLQILNSLTFAGILALVAIGLGIVFGLMGVINLAHGEFVMLGAYSSVVITDAGGSYWIGIAVAPILLFVLGAVVELSLIRRIYESPEVTILATFGLSIVLRQLAEIIFSADFQRVANPLPGAVDVLGVAYPKFRLLIAALGAAIVLAVILLYTRTRFGLRVRAIVSRKQLAESLGIRSDRLNLVSFALGSALAGVAGALVAPLGAVQPEIGVDYLLPAFIVIIVGSVVRGTNGLLYGVAVGAVAVGVVQTVVSFHADPIIAQLSVLALAMAALQFRPPQQLSRAAG